jgi:hypothetical protein
VVKACRCSISRTRHPSHPRYNDDVDDVDYDDTSVDRILLKTYPQETIRRSLYRVPVLEESLVTVPW